MSSNETWYLVNLTKGRKALKNKDGFKVELKRSKNDTCVYYKMKCDKIIVVAVTELAT